MLLLDRPVRDSVQLNQPLAAPEMYEFWDMVMDRGFPMFVYSTGNAIELLVFNAPTIQ